MKINHIGLSGGKDSTALWGWAINESGYPIESIRGSFCDTENEYQEVYDQIKHLDEYGQSRGVAPIQYLHSSVNTNPLGFLNLAIWKKRFPAPRTRFCTEWLKVIPTRHHFESFWLDGYDIIAHTGVRAAESDERAQLDEWDKDSFYGVIVRRPMLQWTIQDVWRAHKRYGLRINPLYFTGRKRVGCRLCIMSSKEDVRRTANDRPWVIDELREWERIVGAIVKAGVATFFARKRVPEIQRSLTITTKSGELVNVPSIDDVVRWSNTLRGGVQGGFDFMFEEDDDFDGGLTCKSAMGHCE